MGEMNVVHCTDFSEVCAQLVTHASKIKSVRLADFIQRLRNVYEDQEVRSLEPDREQKYRLSDKISLDVFVKTETCQCHVPKEICSCGCGKLVCPNGCKQTEHNMWGMHWENDPEEGRDWDTSTVLSAIARVVGSSLLLVDVHAFSGDARRQVLEEAKGACRMVVMGEIFDRIADDMDAGTAAGKHWPVRITNGCGTLEGHIALQDGQWSAEYTVNFTETN